VRRGLPDGVGALQDSLPAAERPRTDGVGQADRRSNLVQRTERDGCQRRPARFTGPPRLTLRAATPVVTAAPATGRARSTTPGLATQPAGYEMYWQYTTASALSGLALTNPAVSSADSASERFISVSHYFGISRLNEIDPAPAGTNNLQAERL